MRGTTPLTPAWCNPGNRRRVERDDDTTALEQVLNNELPHRFHYVVWNYTSDAAKYVDMGGGRVVAADPVDARVEVEVHPKHAAGVRRSPVRPISEIESPVVGYFQSTMSGAGGVNEAVRSATEARRWAARMQARAEVRRAGRRAEAKLRTNSSSEQSWSGYIIDEPAPVTPAQRIVRRTVAVLTAALLIAIGGGLVLLTAVSGGKGYQVAPVLSLMIGVMFGLPALAMLYKHVQGVWQETA